MLVIGIAGGSGSGKTTVVRRIMEEMDASRVAIISQDSYYNDNGHLTIEQRRKINFDHPDAIEFPLLVDHVRRLKAGQAVDSPVYSFVESTRTSETEHIEPREVMIVEGILVLTNPELRDLMDIKVFVDADDDDRLARRIMRDTHERGRQLEQILHHYESTVKPMHLQFIEPSKRYADIIIPQGGHNEIAISILRQFIMSNIGQ